MKSRYSQRATVKCTCSFSCDGILSQAQVVNLSVPGCLLKTRLKLKVGQSLLLRLAFAGTQTPLHVTLAVVRWVNGAEAGVEFIRMSEADQIRLRWLAGHVEKRTPQQAWSSPVVCMGVSES
ncbi:MAG: PilZ domain-containing protein [Nitrospiraceae bacterium]|nr:PilZ domain-containing protein [Nitrospiraceae bacterium]